MRVRKRKRRKPKLKKTKKKFIRGRGFIEHLQNALGMSGVGYY